MPLTPQEQAELQSLQQELSPKQAKGGLTPGEQAEMEALQKEVGGGKADPVSSWLSKGHQTWEASKDLPPAQRHAALMQDNEQNPYPGAAIPAVALTPQAGFTGVGSKLAAYLTKDAPSRIASMGVANGLKEFSRAPRDGESRVDNAFNGVLPGMAQALPGEAVGAVAGAASKVLGMGKRAYQMYTGSPELRDEARQALVDTRQGLTAGDALAEKTQQLKGKSVTIDPNQVMGLDEGVDRVLNKRLTEQYPGGPAAGGGVPNKLDLAAPEADAMRQTLDKLAKWRGGDGKIAPSLKAGSPEMAAGADHLRDNLHGLGEDVSGSYDSYAKDLTLAKLVGKQKAPLNWLSGQTPDRIADIRQMEDSSGVPLQDLAASTRAARKFVSHPSMAKAISVPAGQALKGAGSSLSGPSVPATLLDLYQLSKDKQ